MRNDVTRNLSKRWLGSDAESGTEPGERESGIRVRPPRSQEAGEDESSLGQLGPYELLEPLGSGAMGRVYRARHVLLDRKVAIKVLRPELAAEDAHVERFVAEARAVNLLQHPHVIDVMDIRVGRDGQHSPWFVMELLEGADLATLMRCESIPLARALQIMRQVCEALDAIHTAGIVHRDIKPENIFITQRDGCDFVKLIDFGVARLREPASGVAPRRTGQLVGTPHYMAPEQASDLEIDQRADLYAVGVVLFELITGSPPLDASDLRGLLSAVLLTPVAAVSSRIELPLAARAEIDALVGRCLEKRPCDRPASAREVIAALDRIAAQLTSDVSDELRHPLASTNSICDAHAPTMIGCTLESEPVRAPERSVHRWIGALGAAATLCLGTPVPLSEPMPQYHAVASEQASSSPPPPAQVLPQPPLPAPAPEAASLVPILVAASGSDLGRALDQAAIAEERQARIDRRRMRARRRPVADLDSEPPAPILVLTPVAEPEQAPVEAPTSVAEASPSTPPLAVQTDTSAPPPAPEGARAPLE